MKRKNFRILSLLIVLVLACTMFFGGCGGINGFDGKTFDDVETPTAPEEPPTYNPPTIIPEEDYTDYMGMFPSLEDDAIAAIVLSYKLDYSTQNNNNSDIEAIKEQVEYASENILTKLVEKYGNTQLATQNNLLINLKKDNFTFLNLGTMTDEEFVNNLPNSHIMEMPKVTNETFNTIIQTNNSDTSAVVTSDISLTISPNIASSLQYNGSDFNIENVTVTTTTDVTLTSPYSFVVDRGQAYTLKVRYTNVDNSTKILITYSSTALESVTSITSSSFTVNNNPVSQTQTLQLIYGVGNLILNFDYQGGFPTNGLNYKVQKVMGNTIEQGTANNNFNVTIDNPASNYGVYRIEFGENIYFIYFNITDQSQKNLAMDNTLVKDSHFDAINNGWMVVNNQVENVGWLWQLDGIDSNNFLQNYLSKYSKLLEVNIYKILLIGYGEDYNDMPADFKTMYDNAVKYAKGDNTQALNYNDYINYCLKKIDHIGFTPYDCDQVAEYILNYVVGSDVVNNEIFTDNNANGTFDANEEFEETSLNLITGDNNPNADYRFNARSEEWSKFEYTGSGTYTGNDIRGNYFKNYVNTVYYCVYNSVNEAIPIVTTKFVGNIEDLSVFSDLEDEDGEEDIEIDEDVDLDEPDPINMNFYGDLQSLIILPNYKKFDVSNFLHYIELYIAAPEPVPNFSEMLNIMVQYCHYSNGALQKDNYVMYDMVQDNETITINSMLEPFNNQQFATGNSVIDEEGNSYTEYAFIFNEQYMPQVKYIQHISGIFNVCTYDNGTYSSISMAAGSVTVDGVTFNYDIATNTLVGNGYILYPNADGYFPFIKSSYYADNRFGPNSMAIMNTSYECLQILFNSQQDEINKPRFAISVLGVS